MLGLHNVSSFPCMIIWLFGGCWGRGSGVHIVTELCLTCLCYLPIYNLPSREYFSPGFFAVENNAVVAVDASRPFRTVRVFIY